MRDIESAEQAQLGLKYIEDAVVNLLTNHLDGLTAGQVADALGLRPDLDPAHRDLIAAGVLELLQRTGRIIWNDAKKRYVDNPDKL
jgi:hypothetical protein